MAKCQTTRDSHHAPEPLKVFKLANTLLQLVLPWKPQWKLLPTIFFSSSTSWPTPVLPHVASWDMVCPFLLEYVLNYIFNGNHLLIWWPYYTSNFLLKHYSLIYTTMLYSANTSMWIRPEMFAMYSVQFISEGFLASYHYWVEFQSIQLCMRRALNEVSLIFGPILEWRFPLTGLGGAPVLKHSTAGCCTYLKSREIQNMQRYIWYLYTLSKENTKTCKYSPGCILTRNSVCFKFTWTGRKVLKKNRCKT